MDRCRFFRHQSFTAANARANRLLAVICRTMGLPFRDRPQTWVKPRKSNVIPPVSGWRVPSACIGRKSTSRVLSGWSVSPYRSRRLPSTARTRWASTILSNAMTASSANRTTVHLPARRGLTCVSNHSSSTWCRKIFEMQGETTPPLRGAVGRAVQETVFDGSCIQPFIDHPSDDAVCDSLVEERPKVGVWNRIEILAYIKFEHPVEALEPDLLLQAVKCLVSRATRSEAIRAGQIVLFVDGLQHHR